MTKPTKWYVRPEKTQIRLGGWFNSYVFVPNTSFLSYNTTRWWFVIRNKCHICAASWQNQQNGMCIQRRLRSDWADDLIVMYLFQIQVFCPIILPGDGLSSEISVTFAPPHDKTNKMVCASREDSDQPGHPPSLIKVFAVRMKKPWVLSYPMSAHRILWSDWIDAQADLSLRWAHSLVGFVMRMSLCLRYCSMYGSGQAVQSIVQNCHTLGLRLRQLACLVNLLSDD